MIIDGHRHITGSYLPILAGMEEHGIDRTVLVGIGVRNLQPVTINDSLVFRSDFLFRSLGMLKARRLVASADFRDNLLAVPRNDDVLRAIRERPDKFSGFAFLNPEAADVPAELERCLQQGMCGIKLALMQYPADLRGKNMTALCEVARTYRLPVFMHLGLSAAASQPEWLADVFRDVPFIIAHAGVQRFTETIALARRLDNVFVDTSSYIATAAKIKRLVATLGAEKLIFGSDIPVMCRNESEALAKIDVLPISDADKSKILGGNLVKILQQTKSVN